MTRLQMWAGVTLCPRCGRPAYLRRIKKPFRYTHYFLCTNAACKTTVIMDDRFRITKKQQKVRRTGLRSLPNPEPWPDTPIGKDEKPPWE